MKKLFFFLAIAITYSMNAQNGTDALRYSLLQQGDGTGRTMGVAGATGALGADFSSLSGNPAGLAAFRTSEFMITPGYYTSNIRSKLEGDGNLAQNERNAKFHLNNIGVVFGGHPDKANWTTSNIGFGLNRLANFNNSFYYEGKSAGSIINRFQEKANGSDALNGYEEELAVEAKAIYKKDGDSFYSSDFNGNQNAIISHAQEGSITGRVNELAIAYAANYKDKLLIGGAIGIPFMSYNEIKYYSEKDNDKQKIGKDDYFFQNLSFKENLSQSGAGINAKLGIIFIPTQNVRIGLSGQTPTLYSLTDVYSTEFSYTFMDNLSKKLYKSDASSSDGTFEYKLRTPQKVTGSLAYLFGKKGFISADVDMVDYSTMNFQFDSEKSLENATNQAILNTYQKAYNVRLGAEAALDIFRFRAGVSTLGLPIKGFENRGYFQNATKLYSAGLGIRENRFYADFAYQVSQSNTTEKPYLVSSDYTQPTVARSRTNTQMVITLGFKF
jgi:long-subunit fatty acid transport protein